MVRKNYPKVGLGDLAAARLRKKTPLPPRQAANPGGGSWGGGMPPMGPQKQVTPILGYNKPQPRQKLTPADPSQPRAKLRIAALKRMRRY